MDASRTRESRDQTAAVEQPSVRAAYEATAAERAALPPSKLRRVNIDIPLAVSTCLGVLPRIEALLPAIREHLPTVDAERLGRIATYAGACADAHARYIAASEPTDAVPALRERAYALRRVLLRDAMGLAHRGLLPGDRLAPLRQVTGHRKAAFDLLALAQIFEDHWASVGGRTHATPDEIAEAVSLANELLLAVARRGTARSGNRDAALERQRAFTLFVGAYDELRRAATFLRWYEDDADELVPSIYIRSGRARRKARATASRAEPTARAERDATRPVPGDDAADAPADPTHD